jgi:hypothetical protein
MLKSDLGLNEQDSFFERKPKGKLMSGIKKTVRFSYGF